MAKKGALTKDPKKRATPTPPPPAKNTEAPKFKYEENKAAYGGLNQKQQARYNTILANKGRAAANKFLQTASGGQVVMPGGKRVGPAASEGPAASTPESVTEEGFMGAGDVYTGLVEDLGNFDPRVAQGQYEQTFSQEMDRARQNVMGQFERRNAEEFGRQQEDVQRQIAERGLDPNSPAAQGLYKQLNVRQDLARQEAMSAAEQAAQGVNQQMFNQFYQSSMMKPEMWQAYQAPYVAGIGAQYGQQQQQQQQDWQARENQLDRQQQRWMLRNTPRGGGGGGGGGQPALTPYEILERQRLLQGNQPQPNPWAAAAGSFAGSFGAGLLNQGGS